MALQVQISKLKWKLKRNQGLASLESLILSHIQVTKLG